MTQEHYVSYCTDEATRGETCRDKDEEKEKKQDRC